MKVLVGSLNPVKLDAVRDEFARHANYRTAEIAGHRASSGVSVQPKSLDETIRGAKNRAAECLQTGQCHVAIGIESGLFFAGRPELDRVFDVCACAIWTLGDRYSQVGLSSAWEVPPQIARLVYDHGLDLSEASLRAGYTRNENIGAGQGLVGILSGGALDRKAYTQQAILAALTSERKMY